MKYPTKDEVHKASRLEVCRWWRFLPSPKNTDQQNIMYEVCNTYREFGGMTSEISKQIGLK